MRDVFNRFIDELSLVKTRHDIDRILQKTARRMGFDFFCYVKLNGKTSFAISNYPPPWQRQYFVCSFEKIDPVIIRARTSSQRFSWSGSEHQATRNRPLKKFFEQAADLGIRSGVSIPLFVGFGSHAILTFASSEKVASNDAFSDPIQAASVVGLLHAYITLLHDVPTSTPSPKLTPQQALCLKWSAEGKKMEDIAALLSLATDSVRFHLDGARARLEAANLQQATAIAATLHLL